MAATPRMVGDRKVYPVSEFNAGVASWLAKLPRVWVEGEVTEVRGQPTWQTVFITLTDVDDGTSLSVTMARSAYESLATPLREGVRVHAFGRPELYEARGTFQLRAITVEPVGIGDLLAQLEALRAKLADEGLFDAERKRPLPLVPNQIGVVTGRDAAAKRDIVTTATNRFPSARLLIFENDCPGAASAARHLWRPADACRRAGRRRHRLGSRRRQLRRPAAVQRRTGDSRGRREPCSGCIGSWPRARPSALRPGGRRESSDTYCRRCARRS